MKVLALVALGVSLALTWSASVPAQGAPQPVSVLIVNETHSPLLSGQAHLMATALAAVGGFTVDLKDITVRSSFVDPLGPNTGKTQYELIFMAPVGLEDGTVRQVWLVTCPITTATRPELVKSLQMIQSLVNTAGKGQVAAVTVQDDLVVMLFSRIFQMDGWLNCG
jgi:hypothetical protein